MLNVHPSPTNASGFFWTWNPIAYTRHLVSSFSRWRAGLFTSDKIDARKLADRLRWGCLFNGQCITFVSVEGCTAISFADSFFGPGGGYSIGEMYSISCMGVVV